MPPAFARALRDVGYAAVSVADVGLRSEDDEEVLRFCADHRLAWVTQDAGSRVRDNYVDIIQHHRVSIVFMRPPKKHGWDPKRMFSVLARDLPEIEESLRAKPSYWVCKEKQHAKRLKSLREKF